MKLTDEIAIKMLKKVNSSILEEQVWYYPDNERDGRTDLEFLMDEVSYNYSCYLEDGHVWKDDYEDAKRLLRETKYGKTIPLDTRTMNPRNGYWPSDIQCAKDTVNEVARIKRLGERLQRMGYYGHWHTF